MIRFATAGYVFQSFVNAAIWHDKCNANKKYVMVWLILIKISNEISGKQSAIREANSWSSGDTMMTSSNGITFRVTGPLSWEFIGHRWIPREKASDAEL